MLKTELDPDFSQCVTLEELVQSAINLGLSGGEAAARKFFEHAADHDFLTLVNLDPQAAVLATRFQRWAQEHGHPRRLFFADEDVLRQNQVLSLDDFAEICRRNGLVAPDSEMAELYGFCDLSEEGIRAADLLFLEPDPRVRDHEEQRLRIMRLGQREHKQQFMAEVFQEEKNRGVSDRHRLAPRPWQARNFEQLPQIVCEKKQDWQQAEERRTEQARAEFLHYLRKSYGNEVRAWRRALDPQGTFRLSLTGLRKFFHAEAGLRDCRAPGSPGNFTKARARAGRGQDVDEADAAALEQALNVAKTIAARRLGETEHAANQAEATQAEATQAACSEAAANHAEAEAKEAKAEAEAKEAASGAKEAEAEAKEAAGEAKQEEAEAKEAEGEAKEAETQQAAGNNAGAKQAEAEAKEAEAEAKEAEGEAKPETKQAAGNEAANQAEAKEAETQQAAGNNAGAKQAEAEAKEAEAEAKEAEGEAKQAETQQAAGNNAGAKQPEAEAKEAELKPRRQKLKPRRQPAEPSRRKEKPRRQKVKPRRQKPSRQPATAQEPKRQKQSRQKTSRQVWQPSKPSKGRTRRSPKKS
ncbi:unnamed protein product [Effrenium voratum]|uniref:Uncharacterized protein n=1 Tax=Effrenium voratum TaxID=2562239 RepID=A0AA36J8J7_9DINO|nr:unnamed protein product [Effrenium voratum]